MRLRECNACGLIFNDILDLAAIPYDERYDNRQNFSPSFTTMLEQTADLLAQRYTARNGAVLEVGCGKGEFLRLFCARAQVEGIGFDTSCEAEGRQPGERVTFFQRYATPADVTEKVDLVVCRHVVEHVPQIGGFFHLLHGIAAAGGNSAVYVETPAFEWIVEQQAFWDVFYEHCNYFTTHTLRLLAERAGFAVLDHRRVFGGQYQALELRPRSKDAAPPTQHERSSTLLPAFTASLAGSQREVLRRLEAHGSTNSWAIWGAGAKGVSLAQTFTATPPAFVIDSNPSKQGMFLPGSGIPVIAPSDPRVADVAVVLVANPNYLAEIRATLDEQGTSPQLLPL
ncbi:MAG: class I SAM-dependent methyltransferase [Prosthecobacter sp.]